MKDTITARIGGIATPCQIHREDLKFFEAAHGSAFGLLKRFSAGIWMAEDVRDVLSFATGSRPQASESIDGYRMQAMLQKVRAPRPTAIDAALSSKGPGVYVPLAMAVITACLFGVSDAESTFDDETKPDGEL